MTELVSGVMFDGVNDSMLGLPDAVQSLLKKPLTGPPQCNAQPDWHIREGRSLDRVTAAERRLVEQAGHFLDAHACLQSYADEDRPDHTAKRRLPPQRPAHFAPLGGGRVRVRLGKVRGDALDEHAVDLA